MLLTLVIVALVLAALAVALHLLPKSSDKLIAKAQKDADDLYEWVLDHMTLHHTASVVNGSTASTSPQGHTFVFGGSPSSPTGQITPPPSVETMNGVPVPDGMTLGQFTQLVVAKQGVASFLDPKADPSVLASVVGASDAWFLALGPYYVQQLVSQMAADTKVGARIRDFIAAGHPVVEQVTPAQEAAAVLAASGK